VEWGFYEADVLPVTQPSVLKTEGNKSTNLALSLSTNRLQTEDLLIPLSSSFYFISPQGTMNVIHDIRLKISPVQDWRSTPLEWLSSSRDLDLGSGHTAYHCASVIGVYLHTKCHWNRKNFLVDALIAGTAPSSRSRDRKTRTNIKNPADQI